MKKLLVLLLTLAMILALAACGGGKDPVSGGTSPVSGGETVPSAPQPTPAGPVGKWTLSESGDPAYAPGQITMVLDETGSGYQAITQFKENFSYMDFTELRWSEGAIFLEGKGGAFLLQGDTLTFTWDGMSSAYVRSGTADTPLAPASGSYSSYVVYEEGEEYPDSSFSITVNADGSGTWFSYGETHPMTWNRYFFTVDGDQSFYYLYDGSQLKIFDGEYLILLKQS
ncbi:MAG: hypothetical protein IKH34_01150 [Oscillospiraceae bacterium]|nr:hypothetical protein [Oscillospiraceae bacterium]